MWPFSGMSLETARFWADIARIALLGGVLVSALSAFVIALTADILRDSGEAAQRDLQRDLAKFQAEAAKFETEAVKARENTARLVNEAIKLRRELSEANKRTTDAQLALEKLKAPRTLNLDDRTAAVEELKSLAGLPFVVASVHDAEAVALIGQIEELLSEAGLVHQPWRGRELLASRPGKPAVGVTNVIGIYVQADASRQAQFEPAVNAIATALKERGLDAKAEIGRMTANTNQGAIQILVGKKP
jgi:hypothetical protein